MLAAAMVLALSGAEGLALSGAEGLALSGVEGLALSGVEGLALSRAEGLALSGIEGLAQDRSIGANPSFDVVSVKANTDGQAPEAISLEPNGDVRFTAFPVRTLITIAYRSEGIQRFDQLIAAPSWIATDRFDIIAKTGQSTSQGPVQSRLPAMLQALLRDRFGLRLHTEMREMPAFALVISRRDRRPGPGLHESTIVCPSDDGGAAAPTDPDRWCGIRASNGVITGHAVSAAQLAGNLSGYPDVDRYVTDRTALTGRYDFRLEYSPARARTDAAQDAGASLFTALTEQLGLTLQPDTASLPVLVIDQIERPRPD